MNHAAMGDLPGHVFPGIMFLVWSTVWCVALLRRGGHAVASPWDPRPDPVLAADFAAHASWESWLKVLVPLVNIIGEWRWITIPMTDASVTNYQHMLGYSVVTVSGIADVLTRRRVLPPATDRMMLALAFLLPGFFFLVHGHHLAVAGAVHLVLGGLMMMVGVLVLAEHVRAAPLFRWLRVYVLTLTAAWFLQAGWILYVAGYDLMSEEVVVRVYLFFTWYAFGIAAVFLALLATRRKTVTN